MEEEKVKWECKFCFRCFKRENSFLKHNCKQKVRFELLKMKIGQQAYIYYKYWIKKNHGANFEQDLFLKSSFFKSFVDFVSFVKTQQISDPFDYMKFMSEKKIRPSLWTDKTFYLLYIDKSLKNGDAEKQIKITVKTISKLCNKYSCEPNEIFSKMNPNTVLLLFENNLLFTWILLYSKSFKEMLSGCDEEKRKLFDKFMNIKYHSQILNKRPKLVQDIEKLVKKINL